VISDQLGSTALDEKHCTKTWKVDLHQLRAFENHDREGIMAGILYICLDFSHS